MEGETVMGDSTTNTSGSTVGPSSASSATPIPQQQRVKRTLITSRSSDRFENHATSASPSPYSAAATSPPSFALFVASGGSLSGTASSPAPALASSSTSTSTSSSPSSPSVAPSAVRAVMKPFTAQSVRELKIQTQASQPQSQIIQKLEMEMEHSAQATLLRRMKEEQKRQHQHHHAVGNQEEAALLEHQRLLSLEREALARELDYLVSEELSPTIDVVLHHLALCLEELKGDVQLETEKEEESADDQKKRLQQKVALNLDSMLKYGGTSQKQKEKESKDAESEEGKKGPKHSHLVEFSKKTDHVTALRGFAMLNGSRIYKSDLRIEVKPTWGKKLPLSVKIQVSPLSPLRLPQIQNAHNFIKMASGKLKRLQWQVKENKDRLRTEDLIDTLKKLKDDLILAREELVTFEVYDFPDCLCAHSTQAFLPPPPPEVALEFHVFKAQLILSVYILQITPLPSKLARESQPVLINSSVDLLASRNRSQKLQLRRAPTVGQTCVLQGSKIELMDVIRIPCDVPSLKATLQALEQAGDLLDVFRDKLFAVSS